MRLAPTRLSSTSRRRRLHQYGRYFWCSVCLLLLVACVGCARTTHTVSRWEQSAHLAHGSLDDYHLESGGQGCRAALVVFFVLCSSIGVPLSWAKTAGGDTVTWVGFELLHQSRHLGVSQRRAEWFVKWAAAETVHMSRFEEGLGRIMYVVGALELERPTASAHFSTQSSRIRAFLLTLTRSPSRRNQTLPLCS